MRRAAVLLILGLGVLAAPARAEDDLEALVQQLVGDDATKTYPAYLALRERRDKALPGLLARSLPDATPLGQHYGVLVLLSVPERSVERVFEGWLDAPAPYLRLASAAELMRRGKTGRLADTIVEALGAAADDPLVLGYMLQRLHGLQDPTVRAAVHGLVREDVDPDVLSRVLSSLRSARDESAIPLVRGLLESENVDVRLEAAAFIYLLGDDATVADVMAEAIVSDAVSLSTLVGVLARLQSEGRAPPKALDAVVKLAGSSDNTAIVVRALNLLGALEHAAAVPLIQERMADADDQVAKAALDAIASFPHAIDDETLLALLGSDKPTQQVWAAAALRRKDDLRGLGVVLVAANHEDAAIRRDAVQALGGFRTRACVEPLLDALADDDEMVRSYAALALHVTLQALYPYRRLQISGSAPLVRGTPAQREQALAELRAWWTANRDAPW